MVALAAMAIPTLATAIFMGHTSFAVTAPKELLNPRKYVAIFLR